MFKDSQITVYFEFIQDLYVAINLGQREYLLSIHNFQKPEINKLNKSHE
jgi:hypothetical protein